MKTAAIITLASTDPSGERERETETCDTLDIFTPSDAGLQPSSQVIHKWVKSFTRIGIHILYAQTCMIARSHTYTFILCPWCEIHYIKLSGGSPSRPKLTHILTPAQTQPYISDWVIEAPDKRKLLIRPTKIELIIFRLKWGWDWGYLWLSAEQSRKNPFAPEKHWWCQFVITYMCCGT